MRTDFRSGLAAAVLALGVASGAAAQTSQELQYDQQVDDSIDDFVDDWKQRTGLLKTQLATLAIQVQFQQETPASGLEKAGALAATCLSGVIQDAVDRSIALTQSGNQLLTQLAPGVRPPGFQIGGGGALDDWHDGVQSQLELARVKVLKLLRNHAKKIATATFGDYEHRIVVPALAMPRMAEPNAANTVSATESTVHPPRFLVLIGGGSKLIQNDGHLFVAGQVFRKNASVEGVDVGVLNGVPKFELNQNVNQNGLFSAVFANLSPLNYEVWFEQDADHDLIVGNDGVALMERVSVP